MENAKNKRIEWIDVAKGISIILVVLGHTGFSGIFADWLKAFRMPLFLLSLVYYLTTINILQLKIS